MRPSDRYRGKKVDEVSEATSDLKRGSLPKRRDAAIVALAQLNRKVEERDDRDPVLADLRDSGSIEQDSDVVLFPFREEYYVAKELDAVTAGSSKELDLRDKLRDCAGVMELIVAKTRQGPCGVARVCCDVATNRIYSPESPINRMAA